jgi:predicted anti-sigma-YlaC factor YlaD
MEIAMNCSELKHLIHLDVGDDLRAEEEQQLATHMEVCSNCRSYHAGMSRAMSALLMLRDDPTMLVDSTSTRSVWPSLSREIRRRSAVPRVVRKFNLQVVALSVCSLSLAVVTMVQSLSAMRDYRDPVGFVRGQGVSTQSQPLPFQSMQSRHLDDSPQHVPRIPFLPHETPVSLPQSF